MKRPTILFISVFIIGLLFSILINPYFLFIWLINLVYLIIELIGGASSYSKDNVFIGFNVNRYKRVYTDYGRFYIYFSKNDKNIMTLYQDKFFYLKYINHQPFYGDIEDMKNWVRSNTKQMVKEKDEKSKLLDQLKGWNGYLNKIDERDDKINQILK